MVFKYINDRFMSYIKLLIMNEFKNNKSKICIICWGRNGKVVDSYASFVGTFLKKSIKHSSVNVVGTIYNPFNYETRNNYSDNMRKKDTVYILIDTTSEYINNKVVVDKIDKSFDNKELPDIRIGLCCDENGVLRFNLVLSTAKELAICMNKVLCNIFKIKGVTKINKEIETNLVSFFV